MTIANCPRCDEQVTVPPGASHDATVRCPLCQEEYQLAEALAELPPALIVVEELGMPVGVEEDASPSWSDLERVETEPAATGEFDFAPAEASTDAPSFDFEPGSAGGGGTATAIRATSRSRAKKGSPVKSVLGIVLGGALAFPIAQLILWHLPGELKRDFGAGPFVARYVPQIVPAKFRGNQGGATNDAAEPTDDGPADFAFNSNNKGGAFELPDFNGKTSAGSNDGGKQAKKKGKNQGRDKSQQTKSDANAKQNSDNNSSSTTKAAGKSAPTAEPGDGNKASNPLAVPNLEVPGLTIDPLPGISPPADPTAVTSPAPETTKSEPKPSKAKAVGGTVSQAGAKPGTVRDAPHISAEDLTKRFADALDANVSLDTVDPTDAAKLKRARQTFYQSFAAFGEAVTFADHGDEAASAERTEMSRLLDEIGNQPEKLALIGQVASGWLRIKRPNDGILLYGLVKSVEPRGELFETQVQVASKDARLVSLISRSDPTASFAPDSRVLILGTVVEKPDETLAGYTGEAKVVVLDGLYAVLPAE